jgi:hypothetical protein
MFSANSFGACNPSTDIKENSDSTYTYSKECHLEVGKILKKVSLLEEQIVNLNKQISLKDALILTYDEKTRLWMDTSYKLNDKLLAYESVSSNDKWIMFGLGVGVSILSVWAAGQLR